MFTVQGDQKTMYKVNFLNIMPRTIFFSKNILQQINFNWQTFVGLGENE